MPGRLTLVGRHNELQQIAGALAEPDLGGVVLSGPGGVGKTRLGEECLRIGEDAGYETARVTATASAREIPLGALTPLLGDIADDAPNLLVAARSALTQRAGGKRWILMVDDAHLLDGASATLVQGVASDRTAFLVATVRTGEATPDAIVSLWKDEHARRFDIDPLSKGELAELAGELVGGRLDPSAERALCELAQGNPLALRELVTGAIRDGALREHDGAWRLVGRVPVSERLTEVIARRLETLHDDERAGLELIAVGEPLELSIATDLVGADVAETLEQERLIQVRDERGTLEVWLGHPLHGEILREQLPLLRRRRILGDLAASISNRPDLDRTALLRLAHWRLELGETDDAELLSAAARWSRLAWDLNSAIAFARPVWEQHRTPEIGALLGHALCWTSQLDEAGQVLDDVLAEPADDGVLCFAALCRSETFLRNRDIESAVRIGEEYEGRLPSPWREELRVHQGWLLAMGGRVNDSLALIEPIADGEVERPAILASLIAAIALPYAGRPVDGYRLIRDMRPRHTELWEREQLPTDPLGFEVSELTSMAMAGEFDDAERRGTRLYDGAQSAGSGERVGGLAYALGRVAVDRGRLAEGLEWLRRSIDHYLDQGPELFAWVPLNTTVGAAAQIGDLASAHAAEQRLAGFRIPGIEFAAGDELVAVGWLRLMEGDTASARSAWSQAVAHSVEHGRLMTTADALHALARAGLVDAIAIDPGAVRAKVQGALLTTRLEHVIGRIANDGSQLEAAGQAFADFGANLYAAEAFLDASRAYRHAGDQRAATQAARRGHELAALCPGASTPALRTTDEVVPLTNRERELALLAADGLSTKEIAERLFLSDRTVQNHLNRAYEKLGVSGRRELRKVLSRDTGDRED